jgi:hypothetical protein
MWTSAASYSLNGGWDTAFAAGGLVLLTGGIIAMIKRAMHPRQAIAIVITAAVVGLVSMLATGFPSAVLTGAIVAAVTLGGVAIAAAVLTRPT